jgi:hypothetical protein
VNKALQRWNALFQKRAFLKVEPAKRANSSIDPASLPQRDQNANEGGPRVVQRGKDFGKRQRVEFGGEQFDEIDRTLQRRDGAFVGFGPDGSRIRV